MSTSPFGIRTQENSPNEDNKDSRGRIRNSDEVEFDSVVMISGSKIIDEKQLHDIQA